MVVQIPQQALTPEMQCILATAIVLYIEALYVHIAPEGKHCALLKAVKLLAAGAAMPIFSLVIGRMVNTLGYGRTNGLTAQLNQTTLFFLYLAIASFVVCYLEVGMWMLTGVLSP